MMQDICAGVVSGLVVALVLEWRQNRKLKQAIASGAFGPPGEVIGAGKERWSLLKGLTRLVFAAVFGFVLAMASSLVISGGEIEDQWYDIPLIFGWLMAFWILLSRSGPLRSRRV